MLEFFSGSTSVVNSKRAMAECLEIALGENDTDCDLIVVYSAIGHNLSEVLAEAKRLAPSAQVTGCTCAGVIGTEGASESMKALGIMAIRGDRDEFALSWVDAMTGDNSFDAASRLAQDLQKKNDRISMIHLLAPGIDVSADLAIRGIESVFGEEISVFGATSSDNMKAVKSHQFAGSRVFEHGAVAVGFADPSLEVITCATHGFAVIGLPMTVTRSRGNRVYELDGKPAWEHFTHSLGLETGALFSETIPLGALAQELPQQQAEMYKNTHILRVITKKEGDGSMYMPVACEQGTLLWLTKRDEDLIFRGLDIMVSDLADRCAGRTPEAVFHADCGARGRSLFNRILKEEIVSRMQHPFRGHHPVPWLGMYGFGEFAKIGRKNCFHNYTTALYVILRKQQAS
jgi:hypothetical protein